MLSAAANQPVADTRGKLFESVAEYVFKEVGCPVRKNLTSPLGAQQIDLAVAHLGALGPVPTFFLVECKYWEVPVDSAAVGYFLNTCKDRRVKLGVIISKHGITGDPQEASAAHSLAFGASSLGVHLVVLKESDLLAVTSDGDFVEMLVMAWMEAAATGGVGRPS
ncbi:restriction endonuclease [Mycobacterium sp. C3-094]